MKKKFSKKLLSAIAVIAVTGTAGVAAFAACTPKDEGGENTPPVEPVDKGKTYFVATNGSSSNDGLSIDKPQSITLLNSEDLAAGDTVYLIPGTYEWSASWKTHDKNGYGLLVSASGKAGANIRIVNAAYDKDSGYTGTDKKVTLDFSGMEFDSNNRGVQIYGNYIYWYGIDVCGAGDNGLYIGGSYNTVEYSEFYNNRDTGLQLGRSESSYNSINQWPSYNLIKNCTSHNNYDDETYGENADGFAAKLTVGYGNVFDGCIAYRNSDDGWDLYAKSDSGNIGCVIIYNSVAFENGYLEYTQAENHDKVNYNAQYDEPETNSYKTRDGDGNGFKLGGSVMEGDVRLYNCLSFQNRMHGVTDNSNPGYIKVEGVTAYDNSAAIDNDPDSATFGQVVSIQNHDTHSNIDLARQSYSYNTVKNVLSVKSGIAKSLDNDAYRGSVMNSLLTAGAKTNVVKGSLDADTKAAKETYTQQIDALNAEDVFEKLPVVATAADGATAYTYNISGLKDSDNTATEMIHNKYRNADHSINMGDILAVKSGFDFSEHFGAGVKAGSVLNLTKWEDYTHFTKDDLLEGVESNVYARLLKAKETLTINSDEDAVYQDFDVPAMITGCTVNWTSDSELLKIGKLVQPDPSISGAEYITIGVTRPANDEKAVLTATISYLNYSVTKTFALTVKQDSPSIGGLVVRVTETDEVYQDGGKVIMDAYKQYGEPVLEVSNGAYYNGKLLDDTQYTVETVYEFAPSAKEDYTPVSGFMVNHSGVYRITHKVTLVSDPAKTESMTYQIFVAATSAEVDFDGAASVSVFRDGYIIAGNLTNVTGTLYTVASETELSELTAEGIKTYEGALRNDFKATSISFSYANANSKGYHVYYALANADGKVTSQLYHDEIKTAEISTEENFMKITGGKLDNEDVSKTIYLLKKDLDFSGKTWSAGTTAFSGLLNGQGHTVSGITRSADVNDKTDKGIFPQVKGGTIMNIKFDNINLSGKQRTAIVSRVYGGYFHNIAITNLMINGSDQRTGGLIGQVYEGATPTAVSQVSIVNPIPELNADGSVKSDAEGEKYYITSTGNRVGGIIGYIQTNNPITDDLEIRISDCYVNSYIACGGSGVSSIVAQYDENGQLTNAERSGYKFMLEITNCVSAGVLVDTGTGRIGGMLGYHSGAGPLRVTGCVSIQTEYYKGALISTSQKNQSPTIGGFSTSGDVRIADCVSLMEEYNTDYDVNVYSAYALSLGKSLKDSGADNWIDKTGFDFETKWSYVFDGSGPELKAPYLTLNFIDTAE